MPKLLLASTSPARKTMLTTAGIHFATTPPGVDEDALVEERNPASAAELVQLLARAKAEAVAAEAFARDAELRLVLGCDSALLFEGEVLGKPLQPEVARERLARLSGKSGVLHSGHWLISRDSAVGSVSATEVRFESFTQREIEAYVATGEPLQVAGSFTIDGIGGAFINSIAGDYHTVVGLSLRELRKLAHQLEVPYHELWLNQ